MIEKEFREKAAAIFESPEAAGVQRPEPGVIMLVAAALQHQAETYRAAASVPPKPKKQSLKETFTRKAGKKRGALTNEN